MRKLGIIKKIWPPLLVLILIHFIVVLFAQRVSHATSRQITYLTNQSLPFAKDCSLLLHEFILLNSNYETIDRSAQNETFLKKKSVISTWNRIKAYDQLSVTYSDKIRSIDQALPSLLNEQHIFHTEIGKKSPDFMQRASDLNAKKQALFLQLNALNFAAQEHAQEQILLVKNGINQKQRKTLLLFLIIMLGSLLSITLAFNKYALHPLNSLLRLIRGEINKIPEPISLDQIDELAKTFLSLKTDQLGHELRLKELNEARITAEKKLLHHQENLEQVIVDRTRSIREKNQQLHKSTAKLMQNEELLRTVFTSMHEGLCLCSLVKNSDGIPADYRIILVNPAFEGVTGISSKRAEGSLYSELTDQDDIPFFDTYVDVVKSGNPETFESYVTSTGKHLSISVSKAGAQRFTVVMADISKQKNIEAELQRAQKLESVGQLAAGISHEINTPIQFIGDNIRFMKDVFEDFFLLENATTPLLESAKEANFLPEQVDNVFKEKERMDFPYLVEEIPVTISQTLDGIKRVSSIVLAMKEFAHPSSKDLQPYDLNKAIESTVIVTRNEWKYVTKLETNFDSTLPLVSCLRDEFSQVILNLIINARDAIEDHCKEGELGLITISTSHTETHAKIIVKDDGGGIPPAIKDRIFDPFFTTKEVGRGSGQGLAIAHSSIVKKHHGDLTVTSEEGVGTTFIITLPLDSSKE